MVAIGESEERPKRQRGRPKRFEDDGDSSDDGVVRSAVVKNGAKNGRGKTSPRAAAAAGGDRGSRKDAGGASRAPFLLPARIKIRLKRKRAADGDEDAESEPPASYKDAKVRVSVDDAAYFMSGSEENTDDSSSSDGGGGGGEEGDRSEVEVASEDEVDEIIQEEDDGKNNESPASEVKQEHKTGESPLQAGVNCVGKSSIAEDEKGGDVILKVRVRVGESVQDGISQAVLPFDFTRGVRNGMSGDKETSASQDERRPEPEMEANDKSEEGGHQAKPTAMEDDTKMSTPTKENDEFLVDTKPAPASKHKHDSTIGKAELKDGEKLTSVKDGSGGNGVLVQVRVRVGQNLQDGISQAILPVGFKKWSVQNGNSVEEEASKSERKPAAKREGEVSSDKGGDTAKPTAMQGDSKMFTQPKKGGEVDEDTTQAAVAMDGSQNPSKAALDFKVTATPKKNHRGATLCKAVGCPKIAQTNSEGFCRAHHNRFLICTGQCDSWDCPCGEKIASFQSRCGNCHRWKDGKHPPNNPKKISPANMVFPAKKEGGLVAAMAVPQKSGAGLTYVPPDAGVQISSTVRTNEKGRSLCKVIGCPKMDQSNNDGFCRMHFNMFTIVKEDENMPSPWTCVCGQQCSGMQKRCGNCNKWRGGKREPYTVGNRNGISEDNIIYDDAGEAFWQCENCGNEVPIQKSRCGRCHHWRGGKRKGGWRLGSAMGRAYESDDGIDRTKDWTCCGMVIKAKQSRCGACHRWRGGKRIAKTQEPDNRPPWICETCGVSNPASKRRCAGCQTWKVKNRKSSSGVKSNGNDHDYLVEGDRSHSWKCTRCKFDNFKTEITCAMCGALRSNWQWHKKQQQLTSGSTAPGAASAPPSPAQNSLQSLTTASAAGSDPMSIDTEIASANPASSSSLASQGEDASIDVIPASIGRTLNDHGILNDSMKYLYISIHYDFNQAYYSSHDYSYLNSGNGGSSISLGDGQQSRSRDGNHEDTGSSP